MHNKIKPTVFLALGLAALPLISTRAARADDGSYPTQGSQSFQASGVVTMVDADRDRVTIKTSDGHQYNLDTDNTQIKLRDSSRPGDTGDLVDGMRVQVSGKLLSKDIVAVDHLTVLAYQPPAGQDQPSDTADDNNPPSATDEPSPPDAVVPVPTPAAPAQAPGQTVGPAPAPDQAAGAARGMRIRLRGTVEDVDDDSGRVVVQVNTHERTITVDHATDLTGIPSVDDNHMGLHPGDRVTVVGLLRGDGTIKASLIRYSRDFRSTERAPIALAPPVTGDPNKFIGRISQSADLLSRDITLRLESGREVTVHVPHEARIVRNGVPISVHDLTGDDVVRVVGVYGDDGFDATRIDVLQVYQDE